MSDWLEKIRRASPSRKRLMAFLVALSVTGFIFVLWLALWLPADLQRQNLDQKNNSFQTPTENFWGNFQTIWSGLSGQFGQLQSYVKDVNWSPVQYQATSTATTTP